MSDSLDDLFAEAARLGWWIELDYAPGERPDTVAEVWTVEPTRAGRPHAAEGDGPAAVLATAMRAARLSDEATEVAG